MEKKGYKDNALIKKKGLREKLRGAGINRISDDVLNILEEQIDNEIEKLAKILKEHMTIKGRKTLLKEDILAIQNKRWLT